MSIKEVRQYSDIEDKIVRAVETIADPIRQTLGPRGGNVIFETDQGDVTVTNDGVTIAKSITLKDAFEDAIVQVIKQSALKTNQQAGDGTSTTILLSSILVKEGLKLIKEGMNQRDVTEAYRAFVDSIHEQLKKMKIEIKSDEDLLAVTKISANNDEHIAEIAAQAVREAGADGYLFLEPNNSQEDDIVIDSGFVIEAGIFRPELVTVQNGTAVYEDVPVLVTDRMLYYSQEAETILNTCLENGYKEVVIVAKDFVGEALPFFIANHQQNLIKVLLVKEPNVEKLKGATLDDLGIYLDGQVVKESQGKIVDNLSIEDFCLAKKVYSDGRQTVIMKDDEASTKELNTRIKLLKQEIKKQGDEDNDITKQLRKRLASLTNGIVTVRVGGATPVEVKERRYRYDDSIRAGRAAVADGILLGGGLSIYEAYSRATVPIEKVPEQILPVLKKVCEANMRQIAENAGEDPNRIMDAMKHQSKGIGFNALSREFEPFKETGIFDPYKVTEMSLTNAVSIANAIISSRYLIVNERNYAEQTTEES